MLLIVVISAVISSSCKVIIYGKYITSIVLFISLVCEIKRGFFKIWERI